MLSKQHSTGEVYVENKMLISSIADGLLCKREFEGSGVSEGAPSVRYYVGMGRLLRKTHQCTVLKAEMAVLCWGVS